MQKITRGVIFNDHTDNWFNRFGLVKHNLKEEYPENMFLWTLQLYILKLYENSDNPRQLADVQKIEADLTNYLLAMKNIHGMYDNHVERTVGKNDDHHVAKISHDQMTSYCVWSYYKGLNVHKEIWEKIKDNFFTYNNLKGKFDFKRFVHPRDIIFIGLLNDSFICKLLLPLYWFMARKTFRSKFKVRPKVHVRIKYFFKNWKKMDKVYIPKKDLELIYWCKKIAHMKMGTKDFSKNYSYFNRMIFERYKNGWLDVFTDYHSVPGNPVRETAANSILFNDGIFEGRK